MSEETKVANRVKWIKIVVEMFEDEKILLLESMPEGDTLIVVWFKLLCLCGKSNRAGLLTVTDKLAYTDEMLASVFRRDIKIVRLALQTFEQLEMIEIIDNAYYVTNWEKHQNTAALKKIREQTRKRVAEHRKKQKQLCNADVTQM